MFMVVRMLISAIGDKPFVILTGRGGNDAAVWVKRV
jgi:hypothetical protein